MDMALEQKPKEPQMCQALLHRTKFVNYRPKPGVATATVSYRPKRLRPTRRFFLCADCDKALRARIYAEKRSRSVGGLILATVGPEIFHGWRRFIWVRP